MTPAELRTRLTNGDCQVVDVREGDEWAAGHLAESIHMPLGDLADRLDELDPERPAVAVCHSGARSERAAAELQRAGLRADSLAGGLLAWDEHTGQATVSGGSEADGDGGLPVSSDQFGTLHNVLLEVVTEAEARFGDREPTDDELHDFLRERLRRDGRSEDEIEQVIHDLSH